MKAPKAFNHHLLLLAGSGEARAIAEALAERDGLRVTASLMHPPRSFGPLAVPTRLGGFGGDGGFSDYLECKGVTAVLDATHPFAVRIGARSAPICEQQGLPFARVLRPSWKPGQEDNWHEVADEAAASALLRPGQRVFATSGRDTVLALARQVEARIFLRQLGDDEPPDALSNVEAVPGQGPFSVAQEIATFKELEIDVLVTKNSGGLPSRSKLDAARALGLPVILIARPPQPDVPLLTSVAEALDWVDRL